MAYGRRAVAEQSCSSLNTKKAQVTLGFFITHSRLGGRVLEFSRHSFLAVQF